MSKWIFHCSTCVREFRVNAIEGTKVKCFRCQKVFDVPYSSDNLKVFRRQDVKSWQALTKCPTCSVVYMIPKEILGCEGHCHRGCKKEFIMNQTSVNSAVLSEEFQIFKDEMLGIMGLKLYR
jgi:hypothetical protein